MRRHSVAETRRCGCWVRRCSSRRSVRAPIIRRNRGFRTVPASRRCGGGLGDGWLGGGFGGCHLWWCVVAFCITSPRHVLTTRFCVSLPPLPSSLPSCLPLSIAPRDSFSHNPHSLRRRSGRFPLRRSSSPTLRRPSTTFRRSSSSWGRATASLDRGKDPARSCRRGACGRSVRTRRATWSTVTRTR